MSRRTKTLLVAMFIWAMAFIPFATMAFLSKSYCYHHFRISNGCIQLWRTTVIRSTGEKDIEFIGEVRVLEP